jgi:hypothetical protein
MGGYGGKKCKKIMVSNIFTTIYRQVAVITPKVTIWGYEG